MTQDWYEKPKTQFKPNFPVWLKHIWAAVMTGVLSGFFIASLMVILSYLFNYNQNNFDLFIEIKAVLFLLLVGSAFGLLIGSPIAIIFGPLSGFITKKIDKKFNALARIIIGALGTLSIVGLYSFFARTNSTFAFDINTIGIFFIAAIFGSFIYMKFEPKSV
jgi:hypothetical protein